MKLTFIYQPVTDLAEAIAFYRDQLGFVEAWREDEDTVSFWMPDRSAQIMVTTYVGPEGRGPAGPMYLVDSLDEWISAHPDVAVIVAKAEIPGGAVAGFEAPGGNGFYVFDQPDA